MFRFPTVRPPTIEDISGWKTVQNEEVELAKEEAELEKKLNEICNVNPGVIIGKASSHGAFTEVEQEEDEEELEDVEESEDEFETEIRTNGVNGTNNNPVLNLSVPEEEFLSQ